MKRLARDLADDERGVGVIELLVVMIIMSVVSGVVVSGILSAFAQQQRQIAYTDTLNSVKLAFERTTAVVRAADPVVAAATESVTVRLRRAGTCRDMKLELKTHDGMVRLMATDPVPSAERTVASGLASGTPTFTYLDEGGNPMGPSPDPRLVRTIVFRLRAPVDGGTPVTLENRILVRNTGGKEC